MESILGINIEYWKNSPWTVIPLAFMGWVFILLSAKRIFFWVFRRITRKTKTHLDDVLIRSINVPMTLLIFVSGGALIEQLIPIVTDRALTNFFPTILKAATIVAIIIFADRFVHGLIREYDKDVEILKTSGSFVRGIARLMIFGIGLLVLLDSFGVSVTPVIASLGIGSLAVALAFQPTLENLFSGIQIIMDKPIQIGHFIKLDSGEEGYVEKIGWRSTWVKLLTNNMVVIPNKNLVSSKIVNYYYPKPELAVLVDVGVHYNSDLDHVERVAKEVAKETMTVLEGGIKSFEPVVRFHTFADFSINFTVVMRARELMDSQAMRHEFIKRLHQRFAKEGITIPYPVEAVNYDQEKTYKHFGQTIEK
jgi:small-conductance mechanosensitive channel